MFAIFYDLETSTKNCIGQILNYSFILVDDALQPVDELSGLIRINRLQLPEPGAILANRTNVIEHQSRATEEEYAAMRRIDQFIRKAISRAQGALAFVGYNSSRFDTQYLRTSLIREGLDPYYGKSLHYRDLLHAVQKAYVASSEFRSRILRQRASEKKLSLSLQTVGHALGLLSGEQAHESREDVLLTIRVADALKKDYGIDIVAFRCYEGLTLHSTARSGAVYLAETPEYDLAAGEFSIKTPVALLEADHRAALWINVARFMEKPDGTAIMYRAFATAPFFVAHQAVRDPELERAARAAVNQYKGVSLKTFFERSTCDIEQDIYRLDAQERCAYNDAIQMNSKAPLQHCSGDDAKKLWVRFQLSRMDDALSDPKARDLLARYAIYRYGGKLQLVRKLRMEQSRGAGGGEEDFHPTLDAMVSELIRLREGAVALQKHEDIQLLDALEQLYRTSDIVSVAGATLLPMWHKAA